jgi:lycopene beta-cyclase
MTITTHDHSIKQANIAIIGGGLAGLSLAAELSAPEFSHLSIVIIEPRSEYVRDKTWRYWRQNPHEFCDCESANWPAWRVRNGETSVLTESQNAEGFVYACIASDDFYRAALAKINACSHIEILQGERVQSIRTESGRAIVTLKSASNIVVNEFIFDSRPPENKNKQQLYQHFLGLELLADKPVFDTDCVDLMDFQQALHGLHFMCVLPYTAARALVETIWICEHTTHDDYTIELNAYLKKCWPNTQFTLSYTEQDCLPLSAQKTQKQWLGQTQLIAIDTPAGVTGYAFLEALQDAKRLANLIKTKEPLTSLKRNKIDAWMHALFLSSLQKKAGFGSRAFMRLFSNCAPVNLIRFLSGQANWRDRLAVIRASL